MAIQESTLVEKFEPASAAASQADVAAALCGVVSGGVDVHRCVAARALGRIGASSAVPTLIKALHDEDEDVRVDAAMALGLIGDVSAEQPLLENLIGDPCTDVKLAVVDSLTALGSRELLPWLVRLLRGRDEDIAWDEESIHHDEWDDWVDLQVKAVRALGDMGETQAVADIAAALEDEFGQDLSDVAFPALAKLGDAGVDVLAAYLKDGSPRLRRRAARSLGDVSGETAREAIAAVLADQDAEVRRLAAMALAKADDQDPRLAAFFDDSDTEIRVWAVGRLGAVMPDRLRASFEDQKVAVQAAALYALSAAPDALAKEESLELVSARLTSPHSEISVAAVDALSTLEGAQASVRLIDLLEAEETPGPVKIAAIAFLGKTGGDGAVEALTMSLSSDQRALRLQSAAGLSKLALDGYNEARENLVLALQGNLFEAPEVAPQEPEAEDELEVQEVVLSETDLPLNSDDEQAGEEAYPVSTLQSILGAETPEAVQVHRETTDVELTDEDIERLALASQKSRKRVVEQEPVPAAWSDMRLIAARQLCELPDEGVAEALAELILSDDKELRLAALDSLARIGETLGHLPEAALPQLREAAKDSIRDVRMLAVRALGVSGAVSVMTTLFAKVKDDDAFVRKEAVLALCLHGQAGETAQARLQDEDPGVRSAALRTLAKIDGLDALPALVDFSVVRDGYHCREAGRLLGAIDKGSANHGLLQILDDPEQKIVWAAAMEALEEVNRHDPGAAGQAIA